MQAVQTELDYRGLQSQNLHDQIKAGYITPNHFPATEIKTPQIAGATLSKPRTCPTHNPLFLH